MSKLSISIVEALANLSSPVSGAELARRLNVSRTAIWKNIEQLRHDGYPIAGTTRIGYRLISDNILNSSKISQILTTWHIDDPDLLVTLDETESTNAYARNLGAEGEKAGFAVMARSQRGGRGRNGRTFLSEKDKGLYLSVLLRPQWDPSETACLTAYTAVVTAEILEEMLMLDDRKIGIKWVNDLYLDGKKIAGILTEGAWNMEMGHLDYVVVGIGINLYRTSFPPEIASIASDIETLTGKQLSVNTLASRLIPALRSFSPALAKGLLSNYKSRSVLIGRSVNIYPTQKESSAPVSHGVVENIGDDFSLIVRTDEGELRELRSGEVTLHDPSKI